MDKIGDLLIRIKNGYMASREDVTIPFSKLALNICNLLVKEGFITSCKEEGQNIKVTLKYSRVGASLTKGEPAMSGVKRISKPGRRVYKGKKFLPYVFEGMGIAIVSTPKGLMTDKMARKEGLGGEVMAFVW